MPTVYVNDKPVEIGTRKLNCVQAADLAGVFVPHYCWHEALSVVASCRMCLVEMGDLKDGKVTMQPKVVPGCQTPVKDGSVIVTGEYDKRDTALPALPYDPNYTKAAPLGERAKKSQADTLEGLLLNHPLDCPVCDKAGECKLQDYSYKYGRSESRMVDVKNTPPNKPHLSSKITLFTDRCIMCTRCVRFTREISGTAELQVVGRGHHEEIDVFPGRPLENKLAGNVVDLCPVGALGSKDFLYKQRVWYLRTVDGVCNRCSTGCSTYVDTNKDIVYRLRPRYNPKAQGHFMCDDGRYGYHHANSGERFVRPLVKADGRFKPVPWSSLLPQLKQELADAARANAKGVVAVLSPFLTAEEAYLFGAYFKSLAPDVRLVIGPVPVIGEDDRYPKNAKGEPPAEPDKVTFTIRAEKAPNRVGVEEVLKVLQGEVVAFAQVAGEAFDAMWFAGGYPDPAHLDALIPSGWKAPALLVAQDILPTVVTASAKYVLPATTGFEKDGTFVNHAGYAQTFARAARPPVEVRGELQLAYDLLGRRGLVQPNAVRKELAAAVPFFARLTGEEKPNVEQPATTGTPAAGQR
jgi:NADH-quinone oxidoreductase subunit G